jgi:hypothetical protein
MEKFKQKPHLKRILKEMCKRVGTSIDKVNFTKPGWFTKHSWTEQEQEDFMKWLIDYLSESRLARVEILNIPISDSRTIERAASLFIFEYGWKLKCETLKESK